jgi:hypothetical protein
MDLWFASTMLNLGAGPKILHGAYSCPHRVQRLDIFFEAGNKCGSNGQAHFQIGFWPCLESLLT